MYETEFVAVDSTFASVGALVLSITETAGAQADLLDVVGPPEKEVGAPELAGDPFRELVDLALMADRGSLDASPLTFQGALAPSLLRMLAHERLVNLIEGLIFRSRPRYAERTEILKVPRGRLDARSLLYSQATGVPQVQSTFDELTIDTPLLQVIVSALRVVASERMPQKLAALRPGIKSRSVHLMRLLAGVELIDRDRALLIAERLWLGPLDRIWDPAIQAALPVLRDRAIVPTDGETESESESILIHVSTEKFWEQCLELALENAFGSVAVSRDARAGEGVNVPAPWRRPALLADTDVEPPSGVFPDFMFRSTQHTVVADAKYKLGGSTSPTSQDGYQLFTYSHLATLNGHASEVALILYPTCKRSAVGQVELARSRDGHYPLWLARVHFPTRSDLQTHSSWSTYLSQTATTIADFSREWISPRSTSYKGQI